MLFVRRWYVSPNRVIQNAEVHNSLHPEALGYEVLGRLSRGGCRYVGLRARSRSHPRLLPLRYFAGALGRRTLWHSALQALGGAGMPLRHAAWRSATRLLGWLSRGGCRYMARCGPAWCHALLPLRYLAGALERQTLRYSALQVLSGVGVRRRVAVACDSGRLALFSSAMARGSLHNGDTCCNHRFLFTWQVLVNGAALDGAHRLRRCSLCSTQQWR
jgi:hypothetical protein